MDLGRFVELAALFAADGEWVAPYRRARGPAEIAAWLTQSVPASPRRMHYVMNSVIAVTGDTAVATSNYLVMVEGVEGPVPSVCGTYPDPSGARAGGLAFPPPGTDPRVQGGDASDPSGRLPGEA